MWLIALAVLALVAVFFAFLQNNEFTRVSSELATAQAQLEAEKVISQELRTEKRDNTAAIGFQGQGEFTSVAAITAAKEELMRAFEVDSKALKFSDVINPVIGAHQRVVSERDSALAESARLRNDLAARERETRSALSDKDRTLADVRREKDEMQSQLNRQIAEIERQRDSSREEYRNLERQLSELRTQGDQRERDLRAAVATVQQRNSILADRLNSVDRRAASADGTVLTAAPDLGVVWIDRGFSQRVTAGMEFEVRNASSQKVKGRVKIVRTEQNRSEAKILTQADKYDPIRTDDAIFNAVYDPSRTPVAVLLGNGFGRYDAASLRATLKDVGIEVRDQVSNETDLLLLGTPFFDEETGDMVPWESMEAHKSAVGFAVEIIPMRDWLQWLGK